MAHGATARAGRPTQAQGRSGHGREGAALRQGQRQEDGRGLALGCDPRRDRTARLASAERTRLADNAPEALGRPLGFRATTQPGMLSAVYGAPAPLVGPIRWLGVDAV